MATIIGKTAILRTRIIIFPARKREIFSAVTLKTRITDKGTLAKKRRKFHAGFLSDDQNSEVVKNARDSIFIVMANAV